MHFCLTLNPPVSGRLVNFLLCHQMFDVRLRVNNINKRPKYVCSPATSFNKNLAFEAAYFKNDALESITNHLEGYCAQLFSLLCQ